MGKIQDFFRELQERTADTQCIHCCKAISSYDMYCPFCFHQQYLDGFVPGKGFKPVKIKTTKVKRNSVFNTAEIVTASMKGDDSGYLTYLFSRLL